MTTYQRRKRAGLCTNAGCDAPPVEKRSKCRAHLDERAKYHYDRRKPGTRTWEEYKSDCAAGSGSYKPPSPKFTNEELGKIPICACGIRHIVCDMPGRLRHIATSNAGGWPEINGDSDGTGARAAASGRRLVRQSTKERTE